MQELATTNGQFQGYERRRCIRVAGFGLGVKRNGCERELRMDAGRKGTILERRCWVRATGVCNGKVIGNELEGGGAGEMLALSWARETWFVWKAKS